MTEETPRNQPSSSRAQRSRAYLRQQGAAAEPAHAHPDRDLAVQREHLASSAQRPEREGLLPLQSPAMLVGGGVLAYIGLKHWDSMIGLGVAGVGAGLLYAGLQQNRLLEGNLKQRLLNTMASHTTEVRSSITIDRPVDEVFGYWRKLSNLPRCMRHIQAIERIDDTHWHWKARVPKSDMTVEWDAEIIEEIENELIVWRSVKGSELHNEGMIEFRSGPERNSTQIHAQIVYFPPAGKVGQTIGRFLGGLTQQVIKEDLRRFKQLMETGEVPTIEGQPSGRDIQHMPSLPPGERRERRRELR